MLNPDNYEVVSHIKRLEQKIDYLETLIRDMANRTGQDEVTISPARPNTQQGYDSTKMIDDYCTKSNGRIY